MRRQLPLYAVIATVLFVSALVFSATFFPLRYIAAREAERHAEEVLKLEKQLGEAGANGSDGRYDAEQLRGVLDYLAKNSIFSLPSSDALTEAMIEAVLDAMGDRHGAYYNPSEYEEYQNDRDGSLYGIGITVSESDEGYIEILHIHAGAPIDGIGAAGDLIVAIDGQEVSALGYEAALARLKGDAGSKVSLTVLRGGERLELSGIPRGTYTKQTVISKTIAAGESLLGYVHLTGFDNNTFGQFTAAVSSLEASGADGLIFDLRNNPGGLLWGVSQVLAYVLPDGDIVHVDYASERLPDYTVAAKDGYVKSTNGNPSLYAAGGHEITLPIAVLVNENTASAAELFTAAIRDYARDGKMNATVIGVQTYGKGTVQTTDTAASGAPDSALKISVAHYTPPSGVSYDGEGIEPDKKSELPAHLAGISIFKLTEENDTQLQDAIAALTQ